MDTTKLTMGLAIITVEGVIAKETAKLQCAIQKHGAAKLAPKTYVIGSVFGQKGMEKLVAELKAIGTKETSFRAIFVTRAQWERSFMVHGVSA